MMNKVTILDDDTNEYLYKGPGGKQTDDNYLSSKVDSGREKITLLQKTAPTQQTPTNPEHHKPGISPST